MTVTPSPATAVLCNPKCVGASGASFDASVAVTVVLRESAGLGASVDSIDWQSSRGGIVSTPVNFNPVTITQVAGTNHVPGGSTLSIPLSVVFNLIDGNKDRMVSLVAHLTDDKQNRVSVTGAFNVQ